jgi:hypothetical protein
MRGSAGGFAVNRADHVLPEGGTGRKRVSRAFAVNRADHVHPEGETGPREGQQWDLQ